MTKHKKILSGRLELISSSAEHIRIELNTPEKLGAKLNAIVSGAWPSGEYDKDAMEFFLKCFKEGGENAKGWYGWYAINIDPNDGVRELVGSGGYFGPPDSSGIVEIGYSILPSWQRRGYATELVKILVGNAFSFESINKVIAHTDTENIASVGVLNDCGFKQKTSQEDNLYFELDKG
ncbi:MAG: GNAT family N-acetyltransferase [Colwellia sp.]|nr:GNAT family N-acetyltransferase [Colwellia sp.]